ncbi:MAG: hypothetical protein RLZZ214_1150 [Verrucomicrobiota bacterium]
MTVTGSNDPDEGASSVSLINPDVIVIHEGGVGDIDFGGVDEEKLSVVEFCDVVVWSPAGEGIQHSDSLHIDPPVGGWRYFRMLLVPERVAEVEALKDGKLLDRTAWRACNPPSGSPPATFRCRKMVR